MSARQRCWSWTTGKRGPSIPPFPSTGLSCIGSRASSYSVSISLKIDHGPH
jgi:hypothetical protein